jgi:hypothetical protein
MVQQPPISMNAYRKLRLLLPVILCVCVAAVAEKPRDWQTGTVLDSNRSRYFAGTVGGSSTYGSVNGDSYSGNTSGSETAIYRTYQNFVIEGDQTVYLAQERIRFRWSHPADVTVNGKVKYAIDKRKLYLLDDQGKEHEMEIMKKTLRLPEPAKP